MAQKILAQKITDDFLKDLFPPQRTDAFFDALFGGAEEGAYTIVLKTRTESETAVEVAMELHQRPGKCLMCSLTYGLPAVFKRHPIINAKGIASAIAEKMGWADYSWDIGQTHEEGPQLHWLPLRVVAK